MAAQSWQILCNLEVKLNKLEVSRVAHTHPEIFHEPSKKRAASRHSCMYVQRIISAYSVDFQILI